MSDGYIKLAIVFAAAVMGLFALKCFWDTKLDGWGPYNASTLIVVLVVTNTGMLIAGGLIPKEYFADIFLVVLGFAGGLVAREFDTNGSQRNVQKNRTNKRSGNLASKNVGNK